MVILSNASVREAKPRAKMYELTCAGLPGFILRVLPSGKKVFVARCRVDGRERRVRIGLWGPTLPVEEARRRAAVLLGGGALEEDEDALDEAEDERLRADEETPAKRPQRPNGGASTSRRAREPASPRGRERSRPTLVEAAPAPAMPASPAMVAANPWAMQGHPQMIGMPMMVPGQPMMMAGFGGAGGATAMVMTPAGLMAWPQAPMRPVMTIRELSQRFLREYCDVYLKPGSASNYRQCLDMYILPAFGDRDFMQLTRSDIQTLHARLKPHPGAADYVLCVLGSLYTRIIRDWELAAIRNPVSGIKRFGSRKVERFLTPEERRRLEAVIQRGLRLRVAAKGYIEPMSAWALQLLAYTGLRKDEIINLRWPEIDWQHAVLNLPDTKTGQRSVPVSSQVMTRLAEIREYSGKATSGFVIRSRTGRRLTSLNKSWERIRELAGIPDVRIHDLRHSFASDALMGGVPLAIIGKILGHRQSATTQRYAHLADKVVRAAIEETATRIADVSQPEIVEVAPAVPAYRPLTKSQWAKVAPLVLGGKTPRTTEVLRGVVDGIRWLHHHQAAWNAIPAEYGASTTCWRWFSRWSKDGTWGAIEGVLDGGP